MLDRACFIDPTALAVHPQFAALAIDGKGFTTFVAVNKFIHITSLPVQTDVAQSDILVVFTLRGRSGILGHLFLLFQKLLGKLTFLLGFSYSSL